MKGRSIGSGSPRRFASRDDDSSRTHLAPPPTPRPLSRAHFAHRRGPIEAGVVDRRLGVGEKIPKAGVGAALQGLDQGPPFAEAADAHPADETVIRRVVDIVIEDEPVVEQYAERVAADLHRHRHWLRIERRVDVVERPLAIGVEMRDRARADIADQRRARRPRRSSARRRRWPLRRSVTAEGERPSALARPLRVLPVLLSPARIQSTVKAEAPATCLLQEKGVGRSGAPGPSNTCRLTVLTSFPEKPQFKKTES